MVLARRDAFILEKAPKSNQSKKTGHPIQNNGEFATIKKTHRVSTYIHHWQLRDLICSPNSHTIIHPKQNAIYMYDTKTGIDTNCHSGLPFTPTSLDTRGGYLVLGGQTGMLMIKNLSTGYSKLWSIGRGMNNSICLSGNRRLRASVCNNDQTISIFSPPEMEIIQTLKMPSAINYSSISPDGQKLLMVSDQGSAYLYYLKDKLYQEHAIYDVSYEPSLSCAWNQSSDMFAIAGQDGFVSVFNIYSSVSLYQFGSSETRKTKKAARCIQFSSGPLDLLAYTEHVSNIYIVDTRTFETRQIVRLSPENEDYAIIGLTFSPDSRLLYAGLEDRLIEIQVDVSARRQFGGGRFVTF